MSAEDTNKAMEQKLAVITEKVYLPAFMSKLAELGVQVQSEDELQDLLKIAVMTRMHQSNEAAPEAGSQADLVKAAAASLESMTFGTQDQVAALLQDPEVAGVFAQ